MVVFDSSGVPGLKIAVKKTKIDSEIEKKKR
jgi:hypothetical protein